MLPSLTLVAFSATADEATSGATDVAAPAAASETSDAAAPAAASEASDAAAPAAASETTDAAAPAAASETTDAAAPAAASDSADAEAASASVPGEAATTDLGTVTARAAGTAENIVPEYGSKARSVTTKDDISKMAQGGAMDALKRQPGINVSSDDNTGLSGLNFTMRGMKSDQVGISLDGVPGNDAGNYAVYANTFGDPENLAILSLVPGSSSTGSHVGADGGSIQVNTRDPSREPGVLVKQNIGSNSLRRSFVRLDSGDYNGLSGWISYSNTFADKWKGEGHLNGQRIEGGSRYDWGDGNTTKIIAKYSEQKNFNYATVSASEFARDHKADFSTRYSGDDAEYYGMNRNPFRTLNLNLEQQLKFSDSLSASIRPYYYWGDGGSFSGYAGGTKLGPDTDSAGVYDLSNLGGTGRYYTPSWTQTWRSGITADLKWDINESNQVNLGYWYEHSHQVQTKPYIALDRGTPSDLWGNPSRASGVVDANGRKVQGRNQSTSTPSQKVWLRDRWYVNDDWEVNGGIAYQHVTRRGRENGSLATSPFSRRASYDGWLPELSVSYTVNNENMLFAGISRNMRVPSNYALYDGGASIETEPERSWNKELGWRYQSANLQLGATLFDMRYSDRIISSEDREGDYELMNLGDVSNTGFELNYKQQLPANFNAFASFTYTHSKLHDDIETNGTSLPTSGNRMANTPAKVLNLGAGYERPDFYADLSGNLVSGIYGDETNDERVGGRATFDLDGGVRLFAGDGVVKSTWLRFALDNIFNRHYLASASSTAFNSKAYGDAHASTPYYSIGEERTFTATVEAQF